jgi:hypothetical protein
VATEPGVLILLERSRREAGKISDEMRGYGSVNCGESGTDQRRMGPCNKFSSFGMAID